MKGEIAKGASKRLVKPSLLNDNNTDKRMDQIHPQHCKALAKATKWQRKATKCNCQKIHWKSTGMNQTATVTIRKASKDERKGTEREQSRSVRLLE